MDEKELKRMSRANMLALLVQYKEELEEVKAKALGLEEQLADRNIVMDNSGSIAEASLQLNGVFDAAQKAAEQYLTSIQHKLEHVEEECAARENTSREKAEQMIADAQAQCDAMLQQAQQQKDEAAAQCAQMLADAKAEAENYWQDVSGRLQTMVDSHDYLKNMFGAIGMHSSKQELQEELAEKAAEVADEQ